MQLRFKSKTAGESWTRKGLRYGRRGRYSGGRFQDVLEPKLIPSTSLGAQTKAFYGETKTSDVSAEDNEPATSHNPYR